MNAVEAANSMPPMNAGIIVVVDRKDIPASMLVPNKTLPVKAMMPTHGINDERHNAPSDDGVSGCLISLGSGQTGIEVLVAGLKKDKRQERTDPDDDVASAEEGKLIRVDCSCGGGDGLPAASGFEDKRNTDDTTGND